MNSVISEETSDALYGNIEYKSSREQDDKCNGDEVFKELCVE